jgi:deoxyribodipyrimidine photo-lyase
VTIEDQEWGIHWFRRDLRIPGNEALKFNWKRNRGRTLGVFCFDSKFLSRPDFSHNRFGFFIKTLIALKVDLTNQGGDLLVIDSPPHEAFPRLVEFAKRRGKKPPSLVTWSRDYEPFARVRDGALEALFLKLAIEVHHARDHLLFEPHEILKGDRPEDFYQVYSPYARRWFEALNGPKGEERLKAQRSVGDYFSKTQRSSHLFKMKWSELTGLPDFPFKDALAQFQTANEKNVSIPLPEAGFFCAYQALLDFKEKISNYRVDRDFPSMPATSKLSIYLKNGSLTAPQILSAFDLGKINWKETTGPAHFVKELAWREFYYSILYHRPEVESASFLKHYENIQWENDESLFQHWIAGTTGFPIVDAGMRELAQTGWMHNRVRMIVASFLTKDLLIDWKWGENYFMKTLLDGDLAPNNGGWQWAASTGCDPQPYFRIFNPWLQSAKFDPEGLYIKKFIPELKPTPSKLLHAADADLTPWGYPSQIVNHSSRRILALQLYKR